MKTTLKLTHQELENIVNGDSIDRFEEIFNDIPIYHPEHVPKAGETHRQYVEDEEGNIGGLFLRIPKPILSIA